MPSLSLRLSDELDQRLEEEVHREGVPRSEVARQAISDYLVRRERERFMNELVAEARAAYANEAIRSEALALAADGMATSDEALERTEVLLKNYRGELYSYCNVPPAVPAEERRQAVNSGGQG